MGPNQGVAVSSLARYFQGSERGGWSRGRLLGGKSVLPATEGAGEQKEASGMRITPLDIQHKTFRSALRGYHEEDVDKFLDEVSGELERLFTENSELKERLDKNKDKLTEYKKMEQTLHNTLLTAQRLADEIKDNAEKEAVVSLRESAAKSREILEAAVKQREELLTSIDRLRQAEEQFRTKLRSVLDTYYQFIDKSEQVIRPEFLEAEEALGDKVSELLAKPQYAASGQAQETAEPGLRVQTLPASEGPPAQGT